MPAYIRPVQPSDRPALSRICLLTGAAGQNAESDHTIGELLGLVYAEPYAAAEIKDAGATWGFVLVERSSEDVVGYVLGTSDTRAFEATLAERWWPVQRATYPLTLISTAEPPLKPADERTIRLFHNPDTAPDAVLRYAKAHMHIDILPSHQRQGWGRKLIKTAALHLKEQGINTLHLGIDPRNDKARAFYIRMGFERLDIEGGAECYGLNLDDFLQQDL
ncbi:acyl-CoA N-acyltransferase [Exidia glandulosa HHB12029]|uniref:Acyl-CoA N-acyltransferase n=1 Tax=Exidia glandulosa HHB12029 TaxID=1314781 RepID=A0A165GJW9_EXIGL|nr:acyl-CoA N-acyltransferase [Exidia glandulosa HHB12029]